MCINPVTLNANKDKYFTEHTHVVPCKKCPECLEQRKAEVCFRLQQEHKRAQTASFITLTYEDEHLPYSQNGYPTLKTKDWQNFMKKLRRDTNHKGIKYYAAGEYGDTKHTTRPHYHAVLFNVPQEQNEVNFIEETWQKGRCSLDQLTNARIAYTAKYMLKGVWKQEHDRDDRQKERSYASKDLGINFLTPQMQRHITQGELTKVQFESGHYVALPRYYKDKLFTKNQQIIINKKEQDEKEDRFPTEQQRISYTKNRTEIYERKRKDKHW